VGGRAEEPAPRHHLGRRRHRHHAGGGLGGTSFRHRGLRRGRARAPQPRTRWRCCACPWVLRHASSSRLLAGPGHPLLRPQRFGQVILLASFMAGDPGDLRQHRPAVGDQWWCGGLATGQGSSSPLAGWEPPAPAWRRTSSILGAVVGRARRGRGSAGFWHSARIRPRGLGVDVHLGESLRAPAGDRDPHAVQAFWGFDPALTAGPISRTAFPRTSSAWTIFLSLAHLAPALAHMTTDALLPDRLPRFVSARGTRQSCGGWGDRSMFLHMLGVSISLGKRLCSLPVPPWKAAGPSEHELGGRTRPQAARRVGARPRLPSRAPGGGTTRWSWPTVVTRACLRRTRLDGGTWRIRSTRRSSTCVGWSYDLVVCGRVGMPDGGGARGSTTRPPPGDRDPGQPLPVHHRGNMGRTRSPGASLAKDPRPRGWRSPFTGPGPSVTAPDQGHRLTRRARAGAPSCS